MRCYQVTRIYRNNKAGSFELAASLPMGPMTVGDFNNDGWSDLLLNNKVLQNSGTGRWTTVATSLPDMGASPLVHQSFCGDYNNDGRLDVILSSKGSITKASATYLYRNITAASNAPPASPTGLRAVASQTNVVLSWAPALDDHQTGGLTYNLRVGTTPGGLDIISPMSGPDGFRQVVRAGNAGTLPHYALRGLRAGVTYYWSVQAIDNTFAGSAFAPEQSFVSTVLPVISSFTNQTAFEDSGPLALPFTVDDLETAANQLVVTAISSNPQLVGPTNLVVSGNATNRSLLLILRAGQVGTATITVTVTDGDGGQSATEFQLTVLHKNHPPVAKITVSPQIELPGLSNLTVMSPVCDDATLVLNGSQSSDIDGDTLQYAWRKLPNSTPFATNMLAVGRFTAGKHLLTLSVSDGANTTTGTVEVDVITPAQAVALLDTFLRASVLPHGNQQALLASLDAAQASFARCQLRSGINQLHAFESKVVLLSKPLDPHLSSTLLEGVTEILRTLHNGEDSRGLCEQDHLELTRHHSGKVRLTFGGLTGKSYLIKASTNLLHWERIGIAKPSNGKFEFEDSKGSKLPFRYYHVVTP